MDQIARVDEFYTLQLGAGREARLMGPKKEMSRGRVGGCGESAHQLVCNEEDGLEGEMLVAHLEQVF